MLGKVIFWLSLSFIFYTYAGYPLLLFFWAKFFPKSIKKTLVSELPTVSVVIAAKNEEKNIGPRIENLLAQNYPADKFEILIISDGSKDRTNKIILEFAERQKNSTLTIRLLAVETSQGKPSALSQGIQCAQGEIIVFADARQQFDSNVIQELVANFSDPTIGCVSGELLFVRDTDSSIKVEMGLYWKIEKAVRKLESAIGSVAGATGAIYAIRKSLYKELPGETLLDDVLTPMNIVLQGYRTIFESRAFAYDTVSQDAKQEWKRKVRTLAGNWQFIHIRPVLFSPWRNPIWWRFMSHKIFRLLVPFCLPTLLIGAILSEDVFYSMCAYLQLIFYTAAASGWLIPATRTNRLVNLSYFFMLLNLAAFNGFIYWSTGKCNKTWQPTTNSNDTH